MTETQYSLDDLKGELVSANSRVIERFTTLKTHADLLLANDPGMDENVEKLLEMVKDRLTGLIEQAVHINESLA